LKYSSQDSRVTISLRSEGSQVFIEVENTVGSVGIPDSGQVFKKYYRSALAHQRTGSGLGLYLVKSLVTLLRGRIEYLPGEKSVRFMVYLPTMK
jgi:signal transduction histidine kinase